MYPLVCIYTEFKVVIGFHSQKQKALCEFWLFHKKATHILRKGFYLSLLLKSSNIETPAVKAMISFLISH